MIRQIITKIKSYREQPEAYAKRIGVTVGQGCYISTKHFGSEPYLIEIGNNVRLAMGVKFFTHGGLWPFRNIYDSIKELDYYGKIKIGNNVHIGEDAKVLPGVIIEDNCIIGAGSVVSKSVPSGAIVAGNPAKIVGSVDHFISKTEKIGHKIKGFSTMQKESYLKGVADKDFLRKPFYKAD